MRVRKIKKKKKQKPSAREIVLAALEAKISLREKMEEDAVKRE